MNDRALIRGLEGFHNRRFLALLAVGLLAFAIVLVAVAKGFRDNHVSRGADAMSGVTAPEPRPPATPPPY